MKPIDEQPLTEENARLRREIEALRASEENEKLREELNAVKKEERLFNAPPTRLFALVALLGMILAVVFQFVVSPVLEKRSVENELQAVQEQSGSIEAAPSSLENFTGEAPENTNPEQKMLDFAEGAADSPGFTFTNGKKSDNKVTVDVYIDFSEQKSINFMLLNSGSLKALVESGLIDLTIKPVPSSTAYSIYGPEALAEAFSEARGVEWEFLQELLKLSLAGSSTNESPAAQASAIEAAAEKVGAGAIDKASIQNGTFAGWILTGADAQALTNDVTLPVVTTNGNNLEINSPNDAANQIRREVRELRK